MPSLVRTLRESLSCRFRRELVCFRPFHKYHGNSQKEIFLNISKNHLSIFYIYLKNKRICITLAKNFLLVVGAGEERSGVSELPASAMLENCCFSAFSDILHFSSGKLLNWIVCGIELNIGSRKWLVKHRAKPKNLLSIFLNIPKFFKNLNISVLTISETFKYPRKSPDICGKA